jgi:hypothetical protein
VGLFFYRIQPRGNVMSYVDSITDAYRQDATEAWSRYVEKLVTQEGTVRLRG